MGKHTKQGLETSGFGIKVVKLSLVALLRSRKCNRVLRISSDYADE